MNRKVHDEIRKEFASSFEKHFKHKNNSDTNKQKWTEFWTVFVNSVLYAMKSNNFKI